ncbi:MAG: pentapeptide repeat-containing protein [bacterium]|nr:pentapeptide repeat-containing protein [bacterium]
MVSDRPKIAQDELYQLMRLEEHKKFNERWGKGERCELIGLDFRGIDLRKFDVAGIDFTNCYFRQADLRGVDLSTCILEGASLLDAKLSGTFFPKRLEATEIDLSNRTGTRLRYRD